jgi:predicted  nucleic acid-binding Zn-ribbon protein
MPLKTRVRTWLEAASDSAQQDALACLRAENERALALVAELAARIEVGEARQRAEAEAAERLRGELAALAERIEAESGKTFASADDLAELSRRIEEGGADKDETRLKLAGIEAQLRWESEDLRKALAAIAERVERWRG